MLPKGIEHFAQDHITTESVRRKVQVAIGVCNELLTLVKKHELKVIWFSKNDPSVALYFE